jgi:hypothetical protein
MSEGHGHLEQTKGRVPRGHSYIRGVAARKLLISLSFHAAVVFLSPHVSC